MLFPLQLAISKSNRLYTWGSSPQVLRMQAQAQKKARMLLQQQLLQQQQQQQQSLKHQSPTTIDQKQEQQQQDQRAPKNPSSPQDQEMADDDQFQIITLKDCQENGEENTEPNNSSLKSRASSLSESDKLGSVESTPRTPNNVRLNGPQESFIDPLNAAFLFPTSDSGLDVNGTSTSSESALPVEPQSQDQEECLDSVKPVLPIPDLLAEAVPKETVDNIPTPKPVVTSKVCSLNLHFLVTCN